MNTVKVEVRNEFFFHDLDRYPVVWTLLENGEPVLDGRADPLSCAPGETAELVIELGEHERTEGAEYHLNLVFVEGSDTHWAAAGHVVSHEQLTVQGRADGGDLQVGGDLEAAEVPDGPVTIIRGGTSATFEPERGTLMSLKSGDAELLAGPQEFNFWRAPNDNDRGNGMPDRCRVWQTAGSGAAVTGHARSGGDDPSAIAFDLRIPAGESTGKVVYRLRDDGSLEVTSRFDPAGSLPEIPRVGMQLQLAGNDFTWTWFGRGPEENYQDRNTGTPVGTYSGHVDDLWYPYIRSQETANRTDVRWATFTDPSGNGLRVEAAELLEVGAYPFLESDLDGPRHPVDIPKRDLTTIQIAHRQMGVGGEDSWGARPLPKYQLMPDRTYRFGFVLKPIR